MSNGYNSTSFHLANHPSNLAMRFLLEMSALIAVGYWGWIETRFPYQVMFALGLPLVFAFVWVTVAAPQDRPSGSAAVPVPGIIRLLIELGLFAGAVWALFSANRPTLAWTLAALLVIHYLLSYERVVWLIQQ